MPSLTITVTAPQASRIQVALGVSSAAEAQAYILNHLKEKVATYEASLSQTTALKSVQSEVW